MTQHYSHVAAEPVAYRRDARQRLVVLVGQKKAIAVAVRNVVSRRRWSKLRDWLMLKPVANADHGAVGW